MKIGELLAEAYMVLKNAGVDTYQLDSQLLLSKVLNRDRLSIIINREEEIGKVLSEEFFSLVALRKEKMPVKYILGQCEFMGINFQIRPGVLVPRPDTEVLVEESLKRIQDRHLMHIADVCCGSGAIGLSIAKLAEWTEVKCYDIDSTAGAVTVENIEQLKLQKRASFIHSDLLEDAIDKKLVFDAIVSNPPYIQTDVIPTLMEDVKNYEPYIALWGGEDGLDFYRKIVPQSSCLLRSNGMLAFEIGHDQGEAVSHLLKESGFHEVTVIRDLAGYDRVVMGFKK